MELFAAPPSSKYQYSITGANSQVLSVSLKPKEVMYSEPGSMMMMSDKVYMGVECNTKLFSFFLITNLCVFIQVVVVLEFVLVSHYAKFLIQMTEQMGKGYYYLL